MLQRLLLIEDSSAGLQASLCHSLTPQRGFDCHREIWESFNPDKLSPFAAELVVAVMPPQPETSLGFLDWLRAHPLGSPILAVLPPQCDRGLLGSAARTVDDFLFAPVKEEELLCRIARVVGEVSEDATIRRSLKQQLGLSQLVGDAPAFARVIEKIPAIAATSAGVLLLGETGTGKELCAQAIHGLSPRHSGPFVPVECGALPEHLIENELFGHARGAFTDARFDQKGLAAMADGGTLFLDEVDSLPATAQAKLLRFIEEGTYRALGSEKFARADVRVIAATNRELEKCVRDGQFRVDLYFRLSVLSLRLPPLRERPGDIATLARHFLGSLNASASMPKRNFSPAALSMLQAYHWPGNVRELFNAVQRAVTLSRGSSILPSDFGLPFPASEGSPKDGSFQEARRHVIEAFEKRYVEEILRKHEGNVTYAALEAGKDRRVFGRLIKKYQIDRHGLRSGALLRSHLPRL